jgi:hypothetical protein
MRSSLLAAALAGKQREMIEKMVTLLVRLKPPIALLA